MDNNTNNDNTNDRYANHNNAISNAKDQSYNEVWKLIAKHIAETRKKKDPSEFCRIACLTYNVGELILDNESAQRIQALVTNLLLKNDFLFIALQEVKMNAFTVLDVRNAASSEYFKQWIDLFGRIREQSALLKYQFKFNYFISGSLFTGLYVNSYSFKTHLEWQSVKLGIGNILSNKSASGVYIRFTGYEDCNICIIGAHLPAHTQNLDKRINAIEYIQSSMKFASDTLSVSSLPNVIFCGDLNFRIELSYDAIKYNSDLGRFHIIRPYDQLIANRYKILPDFNEPQMNTVPTFKYLKNTNILNDTRSPSWTDRVLYKGSLKLLRHDVLTYLHFSDHLPVTFESQMYYSNEPISWNDLILKHNGSLLESNKAIDYGYVNFYENFFLEIKIKNKSSNQARISIKTTRLSQSNQCYIVDPKSTKICELDFFSNKISQFTDLVNYEQISLVLNNDHKKTFNFSMTYKMHRPRIFGNRLPSDYIYKSTKLSYPINLFVEHYQQISNVGGLNMSVNLHTISNFVRQIEKSTNSLANAGLLALHRLIWIYLYAYPDNLMIFNDTSNTSLDYNYRSNTYSTSSGIDNNGDNIIAKNNYSNNNNKILIDLEPNTESRKLASESNVNGVDSINDTNIIKSSSLSSSSSSSSSQCPHRDIIVLFHLWIKITIDLLQANRVYFEYLIHMLYPLLNNKTQLRQGGQLKPISGRLLQVLADHLLAGNGIDIDCSRFQ